MRPSVFFESLRSAYEAEIDDLTFDSEGKNVLKKRLADRRKELEFLKQMLESAPEMVSVVFHQGMRFTDHAPLRALLALEPDDFPTWDSLNQAVTLEPWARAIADILCEEPQGEWLMTIAAGLEFMLTQPIYSAHAEPTESDEDNPDGEQDQHAVPLDEEEREAREQEAAGNAWMEQQGFDRKE